MLPAHPFLAGWLFLLWEKKRDFRGRAVSPHIISTEEADERSNSAADILHFDEKQVFILITITTIIIIIIYDSRLLTLVLASSKSIVTFMYQFITNKQTKNYPNK